SSDGGRGRLAPAAAGRLAARPALDALRAGKPLRLREDGDAYILAPAPAAAAALDLSPIEISAARTSGLFAPQPTILLE
ncbi:hypothetical protein J3Q32_17030, partial [Bordetella holmesii]|nr:hypothetical protein [Bordetella holmesii]